jgi:hypothetical protein
MQQACFKSMFQCFKALFQLLFNMIRHVWLWCLVMHNMHDLQCLNACVTPGCYNMDVVVVEWPGSCRVRVSFLCPCWLCTVTSIMSMEHAPCWGPRGSSSCLRVPRAPRARRRHAVGGQAPLMMPRGLGRDGEMSPETPIVPEASPQGLGEIEFVVRALSGWHAVSAFWVPYGGSFSLNVQGVVFYPLLGTLGILIPDSSLRAYGGVEHSFRGLRTRDCG